MEIKTNPVNNQHWDLQKVRLFLHEASSRFLKLARSSRLFWVIILLVIYTAGVFTLGVLLQRAGFSNFVAKPIIMDHFNIPIRYFQSLITPHEVFDIDIPFLKYQELEYERKLGLERGTMHGIPSKWISVNIRYKDQTIPAKIRLKGGTADQHLEGEKWSFRVKITGDQTLFGMKEFAAMSPMRRNLLGEWFMRKICGKEGIIERKYEFVEITINGNSKGIYVLDERYDHIMLERNKRREGPVFKIDITPIFVEKPGLNPSERDEYYYTLDWTAFDQDKLFSKDDSWKKLILKAKDLLERFRAGLLSTHEVFDIEKLARWMALGDVMGAWHGFSLDNMRFYYNPVTSKFEPVPDDNFNEHSLNYAAPFRLFRLNDTYNKGKFHRQLFSDLSFTEKYLNELGRVSQDAYLDGRFAEFKEEIKRNSYILVGDFPLYNFLLDSKSYIYKNANSLREILNPYKGVQAYFEGRTRSGITLKIANNKSIPMEILYVSTGKDEKLKPKKNKKIILDGIYNVSPVKYYKYEFENPSTETFEPEELHAYSLVYRVLGTSPIRTTEIFSFPAFDETKQVNDLHRRKANFNEFSFLTYNPKKKEITFKKGSHKINKDLIIPGGHTLIAYADTKIDLVNSAMILSYSPVFFSGLENHPVSVVSSDKTGQGITVLNAKRPSSFKYAFFKNLSCPKRKDWELTGAVNFYESPVHIFNSHFESNLAGDDYINLIRSEFAIDGLSMMDTLADALDIDFGKGVIRNSQFTRCGLKDSNGDCLDVSGTAMEAENININGSGDKGFSIGEDSSITITKSKVINARIAVAGKDKSMIDIAGMTIENSQIGLAIYQKKREFGPATIKAQDLSVIKVGKLYLIEEGSTLVIDGKKMASNSKDLKKILYGTNE